MLPVIQHLGVCAQRLHGLHYDIVEIQRISGLEPLLVLDVDIAYHPELEILRARSVGHGEVLRRDELVFCARYRVHYDFRIERLFGNVQRFEHRFYNALAVIGVVDDEILAVADSLDTAAEYPHARGVERCRPYIPRVGSVHSGKSVFQLGSSLVRERYREYLPRGSSVVRYQR